MACNAFPGRGSGLAGLRQAGPSGDDIIIVAESEGFEPPIPLRVLLISNQVPSAARPALRRLTLHTPNIKTAGANPHLRCGAPDTTLAERVGFEPTIRFRIHAFQACAFGRSATSPTFFAGGRTRSGALRILPRAPRSQPRPGGSAWGRAGGRTAYRPHRPSDPRPHRPADPRGH